MRTYECLSLKRDPTVKYQAKHDIGIGRNLPLDVGRSRRLWCVSPHFFTPSIFFLIFFWEGEELKTPWF